MANSVAFTLERFATSQRITLLLVGVGTMFVIFSVSRWGMSPTWVPIVAGLELRQMGEATQLLDESGIEYRLERGGGLVTVADRDAAKARVLLAVEGLTGDVSAPGFELFDQPSWGMTDFTQRVNYRRALEGELERTIGEMTGVEAARVHLALRRGTFLRSPDEASEASIVIRLTTGMVPSESMVEGVQALVAGSVEGLDSEGVMVLDERGSLLSSSGTEETTGASNSQLKIRRQVEEYLERRAEALVVRIVGAGNATVRVAAQLNFDQIERRVQAVDPEQQSLLSEDRAEITPGTTDQGAGSVTTNTIFETTRSVETMTRGGAALERLSVAVLVGDRRNEDPGGTVRYETRSAQELAEIELLVGNAVGISQQRGDRISVLSVPFPDDARPFLPTEDGESVDFTAIALAAQRPIVGIIGVAVALMVALRLLKILSANPSFGGAREITGGRGPTQELLPAHQPASPGLPRPVAAPSVQVADPEMAARVVRSWMSES